jgi:hypothetical protein
MFAMTVGSAYAADAPDVLSLNEHFRKLYAEEKQSIISTLGPVIILTGDKVVLVNNNKRQEAVFVPPTYTLYKTVDHIPLMIFVFLRDDAGKPLSAGKLEELRAFIPMIGKTAQALSGYHLPPDTVLRQKQIMDTSLAFINKTVASGTVSETDLRAFTAGLKRPIFGNINDAVLAELTALNDQVQAWRKDIPADQWNKLHVVIAGSHMPRQQSHLMQYFSALVGEKEEGHRLIYMEGVEDEKSALDLLATHILDESIGVAFFKDEWRMHRDLLCDGAKLFLSKHPLR